MNIQQLIRNLKGSSLVAQCLSCSEEFKLSKALLFDGIAKSPELAEEKRLSLAGEVDFE